MDSGLYVALSSQLALEKRLTTLADNVANANTTGFRATEVKFAELIDQRRTEDVAFVSAGDDYLSMRAGALKQTGNDLDFAVKGDAWFSIETPAGPALTRDGRFSMTQDGMLVTVNGYPVLDAGGTQIALDPTAGPPRVSSDGLIYQNDAQVGGLGLFAFDPSQGYTRHDNSAILPAAEPEAIVARADVGVMQGYVEESNVDAVSAMTQLITVSRSFEMLNSLIREQETTTKDAIRILGGGN